MTRYFLSSDKKNEVKFLLNDESLGTLLRLNLSCYLGKNMTCDSLNKLSMQIVESINFVLNKKPD